ncbi:MAG: hypothetical protein M3Q80_03150, partial [bacterium]|nr:hypothetical protein [bacterium]
SQDEQKVLAYKRDLDRYRDVTTLFTKINDAYYKNKTYPVTLSQEGLSMKNYQYIKKPKGFTLTVQFETQEAIDVFEKYNSHSASTTIINGKTVSFTEKSLNAYLELPTELPQPNIMNMASVQKLLNYIPADFNMSAEFAGASVKTVDEKIDVKFGIKADAQFGDSNINVDAEIRKIAEQYFILVNKMPTFFFDFSKIKGKWIVTSTEEAGMQGANYFGSNIPQDEKEIQKKKDQVAKSTRIYLELADKHQTLLTVGKPLHEKIDGISAYKYDLELNKETLPDFYTELTQELEKELGKESPVKFDQATLDYLKSPQFDQMYEYMRKNTTLTLWANDAGVPIKTQYMVRVVPDNKKSDHQVRMTLALALNNVNQEVSIDTPENPITIEEATLLLSGKTKEEYRFSKQISNIGILQSSIEQFKMLTGVYPNTLDDLKKTYGELKKLQTATSTTGQFFYPDEQNFMKSIPVDVYTKESYVYTNKKTDFELK